VLEQLRRRGTFSHLAMRRRMRGERRSFAPGGSAHAAYCHRFNPLSAQPAAGSRGCPQASSRRAVAVGVQLSGVLATPGSERRRGSRGSLPARSERDGLTHTVFSARGSAESEGDRGGRAAPKGLGVHGGRESDARGMCPCVVVVCCRSRKAASDSEKRAVSTSPDLEIARGRGSRP